MKFTTAGLSGHLSNGKTGFKIKKVANYSFTTFYVPETGFEPARPFRRYHLKVVRLPISPPGHFAEEQILSAPKNFEVGKSKDFPDIW